MLRGGTFTAQKRRSRRLDGKNLYTRNFFLEVLSAAADRSAGAGSGNENIYVTLGLLKNFRRGGVIVGKGVGGIFKLGGHKAAGVFRYYFPCFRDAPGHSELPGNENEGRAEGFEHEPSLGAHCVGHYDDAAVAPFRGDSRKPDSGVAAGGLDNY